jgi:alpha-L-fucosidase
MQQRLLDIGKWLKTNGEAIYGSEAFITGKDHEAINPGTNKNIFFTKRDKEVYVICLGWPEGNVELKGVAGNSNVQVVLLGTDKSVATRKAGKNLIITPPVLTPDDYQPAYVFKVSGIVN